ncbi:hypothetical protein Pmani_035618 [Petrolisthes manimaculis]|uniref:Uncharacterized protein n=1 Tax=Petrolisthes manimaculis TaxID=1843537 RepID=A0AAE1TN08_9EUCA|nr:hypothetical protein Pmani_035618 [Petrolisthes manimaculis]
MKRDPPTHHHKITFVGNHVAEHTHPSTLPHTSLATDVTGMTDMLAKSEGIGRQLVDPASDDAPPDNSFHEPSL